MNRRSKRQEMTIDISGIGAAPENAGKVDPGGNPRSGRKKQKIARNQIQHHTTDSPSHLFRNPDHQAQHKSASPLGASKPLAIRRLLNRAKPVNHY
ncbi:protein of unknown function [Acidithiobacillus ferrivorans]|uniref:Uncharacterized protein n=1 Tax=Acidithiobacillus ferrivorans TaxID=160808 RepID=A0A060UJY1_9PROT|nr:hypothetical protein AFERRI_100136 [Acidithiobacillus ferrivorans]SMH66905.1 protein of unknown function [Acidithiobacillus ferrivorans]